MLKKKEFLAEVSKKANTTQKSVDEVLVSVKAVVEEELQKGEKVTLPGICTFTPRVKEAGEMTVRNPRTGEVSTKHAEAKAVVKVKAAKDLVSLLDVKKLAKHLKK